MPKCTLCGGETFHVEEGLYYCSECLTQTQDIMEVTCEAEFGDLTLLREVGERSKKESSSKRKKELIEKFQPWLTIEAYNIIIKKQVDALIILGASPRLSEIVLKLWTNYLRVCEVAFIPNTEESTPKLPTVPRYRDFEILKGRKVLYGQCGFYPRASAQFSVTRNNKTVLVDRSKPVKKSKILRKDALRAKANLNLKRDLKHQMKKCQRIIQEESIQMSTIFGPINPEEAECGNKESNPTKRTRKRKADKSKDQKRLKLVFNERNQKIFSSLASNQLEKKDDDFWKARGNLIRYKTDSMTLSQTICFCYAGLILLQEPILPSDLLRWIRQNHIPYIHAYTILPQNMIGQHHDFSAFRTSLLLGVDRLLKETKKLLLFVDLHAVPRLPMLPIILRVIVDFNLPLCLVRMVNTLIKHCEDTLRIEIGQETQEMKLRPDRQLPQQELQAAALVLITLKLIFGLNGEKEYEMSASMKETDDDILFNWLKWQKSSQSKMEFAKLTLPDSIPFKGTSFVDAESFYSFYKGVYTPIKQQKPPKLDLRCRTNVHHKISDLEQNEVLKKLFIGFKPAEPDVDMEKTPVALPLSFPLTRIREHRYVKPDAEILTDFSRCIIPIDPLNYGQPVFWSVKKNEESRKLECEAYLRTLPESFQTYCQLVFTIYETNAKLFLNIVHKLEQLILRCH